MSQENHTIDRNAEYMSTPHLSFFRTKILEMRNEALDRLNRETNLADVSAATADPADRASAEEERTTIDAVKRNLSQKLTAIEGALSRITAGDYGYCVDLGSEIGLDRLIANPLAIRCIEAQQKLEIRDRQFGGPRH